MRTVVKLSLFLLILLGGFTLVMPALAQDNNVTDDEVNEVAKDIYCPVCESTPLDVCATQACADWRELIRTKLAEGQNKQEIFDYFARQYGDGVLANPPSRGVSLVILWIMPVVLILFGLLIFGRFMRNLRAQPAGVPPDATSQGVGEQFSPPPETPAYDDEYLTRIEEELRKE